MEVSFDLVQFNGRLFIETYKSQVLSQNVNQSNGEFFTFFAYIFHNFQNNLFRTRICTKGTNCLP